MCLYGRMRYMYDNCYISRYPGFAKSEEAAAIQRMLTAYDEGDQEYVMSIVKSPLFRYMDNDVRR